MESKKANLLINISKKIVEQYRDQLEQSALESRQKDLDEYSYENFVDRVGRNVKDINDILSNYEKSIFDGQITDNKTMRAIYTRNGIEYQEVLYTRELSSKEEREISEALLGIETLFHFLGIPEYTMYPIIADIDTRLQDRVYDGQHNINEDMAKKYDRYFNLNGDYAVGELEYNNTLAQHITADTKIFRYSTLDKSRFLYPTGGHHDLIINTNEINKLVDEYIVSELNEKSITGLKEQNELVKSTMELLSKMNPKWADSEVEWSVYYCDHYSTFEGKEYYKYPREVKNKSSKISELEDAKSQVSKLLDLTKEEQELLNRLAQIQQEKQQILGVVSKLDSIKEEEKSSTYTKPEYPNRQYVDEYHYIENGTHYHLPNWDKINNERHEILK